MPGTAYFKNLMGATLTEKEFEDIPHAMTELYVHVTLKMIQAGAIIGTTVAAPIACLVKGQNRNMVTFMRKASKYGRNGLIFGLIAGPAACYAKVRTIENLEEGLFDRDYRLRHNRGQVRVDQGSLVGAIAGAGLTAVKGHGVIGGAMLGISAGTLAMAVYNQTAAKK